MHSWLLRYAGKGRFLDRSPEAQLRRVNDHDKARPPFEPGRTSAFARKAVRSLLTHFNVVFTSPEV